MTTRYSHAEFGCATFADNNRTYAYHLWACANDLYPDECQPTMENCSCELDDSLVPYVDPITDVAPWYDPSDPASAEFLGVMILGVDGDRDSTVKREVSDAFGDGSILNRQRLIGRSLVFELLILATSCRGQDYGIEWLRRVFETNLCGCAPDPCDSCAGKRLTLRSECGDGLPCDTGLRSWESTGVVDGIKLVKDDNLEGCSCIAQRASLTLQSEHPYSFSCEEVACDLPIDPDAFTRCYDWETGCQNCCVDVQCERCLTDLGCTCFGSSDATPTEIRTDDCWCEPLERLIQTCCIDFTGIAYDTAFKIALFSGYDDTGSPDGLAFTDLGLRNTRISIYDNPDGLDCIDDVATYDAWCATYPEPRFELQIPYVPSNATLTLDGRTNKILMDCDGACRPFPYQVSNLSGTIFPLVTQCDPVMIVVEWDILNSQQSVGANRAVSQMTATTFRRRLS